MSNVVKTVNITKFYPSDNVHALRGVSLEIKQGEIVAITGPSGSGKSTLLNMIGATDHPTSGQVYINDIPLNGTRNLDRIRAQYIGFVFQMSNLIPTLTSCENIEIAMTDKKNTRQKARELLEKVSMAHRENHIATKLSGGERQRVAIARALANNPHLILADEPTGNLDSTNGKEVIKLLTDLQKSMNTTLIVVTHNLEISKTAGRILEMKDGLIITESPAK